jgi:hypothetical protein
MTLTETFFLKKKLIFPSLSTTNTENMMQACFKDQSQLKKILEGLKMGVRKREGSLPNIVCY